MDENFEAGNLTKTRCDGGRRSTFSGNSALLPSYVIDFAMFGGKQFHCEMSGDLEVIPIRPRLGKNFQLFNNERNY